MIMKWRGNVQESCQRPGEVGTRSNEVGKEDRGSPDEPRSVSTSPSESEASEAREDFGVTGRGSDAKGVGGKEVGRKGNEREVCKSPWDEGKEKGTRRKGEGQGE